MVRLKPFNGIRYNKDKVEYSAVVTQPYDKISPELLDKYYAQSPYTMAKLDKSKAENPYLDAEQNLFNWLKEGVLVEDTTPCLYAYYQEYQANGHKKLRKGFVSLVGLEEFSKKVILPHERTLSGPKVDRLNLLRATNTHFGQIFFLYSDPKNEIDHLLTTVTSRPADETAIDHFQDKHMLWKVEDEKIIAKIQSFFKDKQLLIADGHHRYETSCNFARENGQAPGTEGPFAYTMATLINMDDEGLTVLPTHRMLHGLPNFDPEKFLGSCKKYFHIREMANLDESIKFMEQFRDQNAYGFYAGKKSYLLYLEDQKIMDQLVGDTHPAVWKKLDVSILHTVIIEHILGISREQQEAQTNLSYIRTAYNAFEAVKKGKEQAVFFMNNTPVHAVYDVAQTGDVMPQKSTDFYPKLLSGMVMYKIK